MLKRTVRLVGAELVMRIPQRGGVLVCRYACERIEGTNEGDVVVRIVNLANGEVYKTGRVCGSKVCDCQGFRRWSHCKHADAVSALIDKGKIV